AVVKRRCATLASYLSALNPVAAARLRLAVRARAVNLRHSPCNQSGSLPLIDVVGVTQTSAGAGLFMRKADKMYACFASETPTSPTISTRYCKPVEWVRAPLAPRLVDRNH